MFAKCFAIVCSRICSPVSVTPPYASMQNLPDPQNHKLQPIAKSICSYHSNRQFQRRIRLIHPLQAEMWRKCKQKHVVVSFTKAFSGGHLFVLNVAVTGSDLLLELFRILIPELSGLAVQRRCASSCQLTFLTFSYHPSASTHLLGFPNRL